MARCREYMTGMDAPREKDSERDGFLSYSAEWHAFSLGFFDGMKNVRARPTEIPDNEDAQKEKHYYTGAYVLGTILQLLILILLGNGLLGMV